MPKLTVAVVTPVGPGQDATYAQCAESIKRAFETDNGGFANLLALRIDDPDGSMGPARARNLAIGAAASHGADWLLFVDPEDLLAPQAFGVARSYRDDYDAIWGQVFTYKTGDSEALKREPQVDQTETIADILNGPPDMALQTGHFLKTSVAQQFLFDESLPRGGEFDQYLRVWENARCLKAPQPITLQHVGPDGRIDVAGAKRIFTKYRIKHGITHGRAPRPTDYRMDIAICGLIGCGTWEISQLLTVPGERIVLDEPAILGHEWAKHVQDQLRFAGIDIADRDWARKNYLSYQEFFDVQILPRVSELAQWGLRTTRFEGWQELLATYPPEQLVLCVRDIRDVILAHVDVALRMGIPIDGSFIEHRTIKSAAALIDMHQHPHTLVRYEDLAAPGGMRLLSQQLGMDLPGDANESVPLRDGPARRHLREQRPQLLEFVDRVWQQCDEYCRTFGYDRPTDASRNQVA